MRSRVLIIVAVAVAAIVFVGGALALWLTSSSPSQMPMAPPAMEAMNEAMKDAAPSAGANSVDARPPEKAARKQKAAATPALIEKNGVKRVSCDFACAREDSCGFRDADVCAAAACDEDVRKASRSDYCFVDADDCAKAAVCSCDEGCWKRGECVKDHSNDVECTRACVTLMQQHPTERYREDRCVLEQGCDAIATCASNNTY